MNRHAHPLPKLQLTGPEQAVVSARLLLQAANTLLPMGVNDAALAAAIGTLVRAIEDRRPGSQLGEMVTRVLEER